MAHLRLFFIASIVTIFYVTIVYSATLHSENFVGSLQKQIALNANGGNIRIVRGIESENTTNGSDKVPRHICDKQQPCGWAIYVPFIRSIDEYISNKCSCADKSYKCIRTDDDLSVNAYIYRCRQNATGDILTFKQNYS